MSTSAVPFATGATKTATNYNFLSSWDAIQLDKDPKLIERFGTGRLTSLLEFFNYKKPASTLKYSHFEKDRVMPKIKATNGGAGSAGASVTFTLAADSDYAYDSNNSPYAGSASTQTTVPVRVGDLIMIKPASGTVSFTTIVQALVTAVLGTTFTAYPLDSTDSIPSVSSADEIVIFGNAHAEGSNRPAPLTTKATEFTNQLHIFKDTAGATEIGAAMKTWFEVNGQFRWYLPQEKDALNRILNYRELTLLTSNGLSNSNISNLYNTAGNGISMAKGIVSEIIERGNTLSYSGLTGLTIADLEDLIITMDKQKAAKNNLLGCGIALSVQLDGELRDQFKNGAVTYGMFSGDAAKNVNLGFQSFTLGNYTFNKKVLDAMNEAQTLGASGFNYAYEAIILPSDMTSEPETGEKVPSIRMRYLQQPGGKSEEMVTTYYDGRTYSENGTATEEVRYSSICGIEVMGANRTVYIKKS